MSYCLTDAEWDFCAPEPVPALELRGAAEDVAGVAAEDSAELAPVWPGGVQAATGRGTCMCTIGGAGPGLCRGHTAAAVVRCETVGVGA